MTSEHALEWVNVREGSVNGAHPPRQAHLVNWARGGYRGRCGFDFSPGDVAPRARYPRCPRCAELADVAAGAVLALIPIPPSALWHGWVITRSNPDDWGLYRDGRFCASLKTLAEAERIIAESEAAS